MRYLLPVVILLAPLQAQDREQGGVIAWDAPVETCKSLAQPYLERLAEVGKSMGRLQTVPQFQSGLPVNYDESKVGTYTLPDPLQFADGKPVRTAREWTERRRAEILRLFETHVYGRSPGRPKDMRFEVFDTEKNALGGKAIRKQVTIYFSSKKDGPKEDLLLYLPAGARKPVPVILSLNFSGNQTVIADPGIKLGTVWDRQKKIVQQAAENSRGSSKDWQVEKVLAQGYGLATIHYTDIEQDFNGGLAYGVRPTFLPGQTAPEPDEWGAIGAWAWGLSRAMDYLETDRAVDPKRVAVMGHSRLGKTALWAGAQDTRFALVWANCSGEGGAALARRDYGEAIRHMNLNFPYWFCANHVKYGEDAGQMPVDHHELLTLIAPRYLYLSTAEEDRWADPKGEFLSAVAAGPVFRLLGRQDLGTTEWPALNQPVMHDIGYHYRSGRHEVTPFDWEQVLKFMAMHWTGSSHHQVTKTPR